MADKEHVVFIPNALGDGKHFTKKFDNIEDANALSEALNHARSTSKAILIEGELIMPDALHSVMVREVIDFDEILKQAQERQEAVKEERKQAAQRQAESLRSQADSLTEQADATKERSEYTTPHSTGGTTDSQGAGSGGAESGV